jgi:hypothetical protein
MIPAPQIFQNNGGTKEGKKKNKDAEKETEIIKIQQKLC